jgi:pimeloyl-ACP methyl ester carboxylesterase
VRADGTVRGHELVSGNQIVSGDSIFTNGIRNGFDAAVKNATSHLHQSGLLGQSYVLNFNQTKGFFADMLEASRDIVGAHTGWAQSNLAENMAGLLDRLSQNGVSGINLVGHSQGGAITASALRYASKAGLNLRSLSGGGVALHGAPVNAWMARTRLADSAGVSIVSRHQFGDAIHVLGGLNVTNPLELPVALLRAPALFSGDPSVSPHSLPCGGGTTFVCTN